jgi:hypothetical protein
VAIVAQVALGRVPQEALVLVQFFTNKKLQTSISYTEQLRLMCLLAAVVAQAVVAIVQIMVVVAQVAAVELVSVL